MHTKAQIKQLIQDAVAEKITAGCSLLLIQNGCELLYCEDGYADLEHQLPIRRNTIYRLYSMTKPVTAAAAMLLMERGMLDLCSPVSDFLPGFAAQKVWTNGRLTTPKRPVLVKDLLNMTSGLVYSGTDTPSGIASARLFEDISARLDSDSPLTTLEVANALGQIPLSYEPGTWWQYGSSADVLGAVIETVSGVSFGKFLKKEFFEPLEMSDTGFWVPSEKQPRLARVYSRRENGTLLRYTGCNLGIRNDMSRPNPFESGGAGLVSTIDDYAHFAQMLLNGGTYRDRRILSPRTVSYFTQGKLETVSQQGFSKWLGLPGHTYSNFLRVLLEPGQALTLGSIGEYGWDGWLGCYFCNCPADNLTILMMMQKTDSGTETFTRKLRNLIFAGLN